MRLLWALQLVEGESKTRISPQSDFVENVYGAKKLHIRNQHVQLPRSPFKFRQGTSDRKQKIYQQNLCVLIGYRKKKSFFTFSDRTSSARSYVSRHVGSCLSFLPSLFRSCFFLTNRLTRERHQLFNRFFLET